MFANLFKRWAPDEAAELGLFFLERPELVNNSLRANCSAKLPRAAGMAFLIDQSGLLVTASHVPLVCGSRPGQTVTVFGVETGVSVEVQAEVLEVGWLGPLTDEGMALPRSRLWDGLIDERPDVFRQDVCFLRLVPETAKWHLRGAMIARAASPTAALLDNARVLPLGLATHREKGARLKCWMVNWEHGAPVCHPGFGHFDEVGPALYDALRFRSDVVGYGFSGSPVWHEKRGVVLGVHRRCVLALPGSLIAAETRALVRALPQLSILPDRRLFPLLKRPAGDHTAGASQRHPEFRNWYNPECLVEQEISEIQDVRSNDVLPPPAHLPALSHLVSLLEDAPRRQILLHGAPGSGKSTLLRQLASTLADRALAGTPCPLVPVLVSARDLVKGEMNLRRVLNEQCERFQPVESGAFDVLSCIEETGARLILLVDALDEVSQGACLKILGSLLWTPRKGQQGGDVEASLVHHVVIASRPTDDIRRPLGPDRPGLLRFNLHLLGPSESLALALALLGNLEDSRREALVLGLQALRVASKGATPLQVWMAAIIFRHHGRLPARPLDLVHEFVTIVTSDVVPHLSERYGLRISDRVEEIYAPAASEILALIADESVRSQSQELTEAQLLDRFKEAARGEAPAKWLADPKDLLRFVFEMLPNAVGVLGVTEDREGSARLAWTHATFTDYLGACHALTANPATASSRKELLRERLKLGDHWPALHALNEMERRKEFESVASVIDQCLNSSGSTAKPLLFALRALAVGIDGCGLSRKQQVKALVRSYVADYREPSSCSSLFNADDLPNAEEILARPELRNDIREALEERFAMRLRLAKRGRAPKILTKEAELIKCAGLWYEMEALGLLRPIESDSPFDSLAPSTVEGATRLFLQQANGQMTALDMPSMTFAEGLVQAARANPSVLSTARLVAIASTWLIARATGAEDA